jgi:plasmid replication initiation protein
MEQLVGAAALALERGGDACSQQYRIERLGQAVVGTRAERAHDRVAVVERGEHEHRNVATFRHPPHPLEDLEAGQLRHQHVEDDEVEGLRLDRLQRRPAVLHGDHVARAVGSERVGEDVADVRIVLGDQEPRAPAHRRHPVNISQL